MITAHSRQMLVQTRADPARAGNARTSLDFVCQQKAPYANQPELLAPNQRSSLPKTAETFPPWSSKDFSTRNPHVNLPKNRSNDVCHQMC